MIEKIESLAFLNLSKKSAFIFVLILTTIFVIDATIVKFSSYSGLKIPMWLHLVIFLIFSIIFLTFTPILVNYVRKLSSGDSYQIKHLRTRYFYIIICSTLIVTTAITLIIIFQMLFLNKYNLILLEIQTYFSYLSALAFLSYLIYLFTSWLTKKINYIIILFVIAFSLASVNLIVSLIYIQSYFSFYVLPDVKPYPITSYVVNIPGSPITESLSMLYDILSLSSFLVMWISTAILLGQYRYKIGRIKFFVLLAIPLIYYIFPFQNYFIDQFFIWLFYSPVIFSTIYILIFSATKEVGAFFFGLSFWSASSFTMHPQVHKSLLISFIGMVILFCSIEISPLRSHVYPPYGFITEAFLPIGAYLLLIGVFTSSQYISQDTRLRKEFYKSAEPHINLLKSIGVSEMEKQFGGKIKSLQESSRSLKIIEPKLEEARVREILRDVLNELYQSKIRKEKT